jgi:hypothetical protein
MEARFVQRSTCFLLAAYKQISITACEQKGKSHRLDGCEPLED